MGEMEENMGNRDGRKLAFALLWPALFLFAASVQAASLEKIEVASRLGEAFYAEVPLKLESNELASKVFVEIAAPSDYKIFEVYRDPILKAIRADVASDKRGVRVELSSRSRIKSPFFNLVLKIRYGRVSHFKKFPVFLDTAKAIQQAATKTPQPTVDAIKQPAPATTPRTSLTKSAGQAFMPESSAAPVAAAKVEPKYYEGWARTDRYGPIVRGDTLSTVAERLRIDYRYTRNQIMMSLFEKNKASFDQNNMNLLKAGAYLNVPTAAEMKQHNKAEASRFLAKQESAWKQLTQQPRYAAEAEAQRTRYTKRISVGEHADGVAAAPVAIAEAADKTAIEAQIEQQAQAQNKPEVGEEKPAGPIDEPTDSTASQTAEIAAAVAQAQAESSQILDDLRQQNTLLLEQQSNNQKSIEALNRKIDNDAVTAAAAKAHLEKLEILISRLQSDVEKVEQQKPAPATGMDWMLWLLIALVVILLGIVAILMRREPAHPAAAVEPSASDESAQAAASGSDEALESVIEQEVAGIETGESELPITKETATIDSLPVFTDELSDTDTTELEPFDADANVEPDADIDYLAEADVYIRYGMDDEAIKQLDMALRLQPDNVEAHIKKAELLLGKSDKPGLDETVAAATMTLAAVDLERFKASIEKLGAETEQHAPEAEVQQPSEQQQIEQIQSDQIQTEQQPELDGTMQNTLPLDESAADDLDFDLSDLDVPDIEVDKQLNEQAQADAPGADETEEMSWLHDVAFDGDIQPDDVPDAMQSDVMQPDVMQQTAATDEASTTQELDNLLTEFADNESDLTAENAPLTTDLLASASTDTVPDFDLTGGATQELDHLLAEFSDQDTLETAPVEDGQVEINPVESNQTEITDINETAGATQHLDQLLSEFDDDDDGISLVDTQHGLDAVDFEQEKDDAIGLDTDHGATQELDNLLSEFSNEDEQTIDIDQSGLDSMNLTDGRPDDVATDADPKENDSEHSATQVLGHLLDEFNDEFDDDKEDDKKS